MPVSFLDDFGNPSSVIRSSRLGGIRINPSVTVLHGVSVNAVSADIRTAVDPELYFDVVLPWPNGTQETIADLVQEVAQDIDASLPEPMDGTEGGLRQLVEWALPPSPPDGWTFELEPRNLSLDDGQQAGLRLAIAAPTPGAVAFAIQARSDGDTVFSDLVALDVPPDGGPAEFGYL
jgi:hypothetical protein